MASSGQSFPVSTQASGVMLPNQGAASNFGQPAYTQPQPAQITSIPHQQSFSGPSPSTTTVQAQMMSPTKSRDLVAVCRLGQETNQELVNKMLEVFKQFKTMQLPNGTNNNQFHERKMKIEECLRQLNIIFRKLRAIYDRVSEAIVDPNENPEEVLVPLKGDLLEDRNTNTEAYKYAAEEQKVVVEQLTQKNRQIKEVIDKIRKIMWEINTMIVMRKT